MDAVAGRRFKKNGRESAKLLASQGSPVDGKDGENDPLEKFW